MRKPLVSLTAAFLGIGTFLSSGQAPPVPDQGIPETPAGKTTVRSATPEQEEEIKRLIEDLVITDQEEEIRAHEEARSEKARAEAEKKANENPDPLFGVDGSPPFQDEPPPDVLKMLQGFQKTRNEAFEKLTAFKDLAFPLLAAHLEDKRPSLKWWGHSYANTVGRMCYRVIHDQLTEFPAEYGGFGHVRTGRDGKDHVRPYWDCAPHGKSGGLGEWLIQNQNLSYTEKRIKCLTWLLNEEKRIGVIDPRGYYVNILPLELGILELRAETGHDVTSELNQVRGLLKTRPGNKIPKELMPDGPLPEVEKDHAMQETSAKLGTCPDGHANLRDIPVLYGTFPVLTKDPADWNDEDRALAKRRDAKEVILGGEPDDARDPRFQSRCVTCGYYLEVNRVPGTGSNWIKKGQKFSDFSTPFFPATASLPFAKLPDTGISVEIDRDGYVVSEIIEATVPADKKNEMVAKIESWIDENKFQRDLLHVEIPRYPRKYEERVEDDQAWFFIEVQTSEDRKSTRFAFVLERSKHSVPRAAE